MDAVLFERLKEFAKCLARETSSGFCVHTKRSSPARQIWDFGKKRITVVSEGTKISILPGMKDEFGRRLSESRSIGEEEESEVEMVEPRILSGETPEALQGT
jgi:hypothetical protein